MASRDQHVAESTTDIEEFFGKDEMMLREL